MQSRRQGRSIKSEINIVPFLDVLLVLLLIFMATAPIISQSVQVDLPDSTDSQTVSNEDKHLLFWKLTVQINIRFLLMV